MDGGVGSFCNNLTNKVLSCWLVCRGNDGNYQHGSNVTRFHWTCSGRRSDLQQRKRSDVSVILNVNVKSVKLEQSSVSQWLRRGNPGRTQPAFDSCWETYLRHWWNRGRHATRIPSLLQKALPYDIHGTFKPSNCDMVSY